MNIKWLFNLKWLKKFGYIIALFVIAVVAAINLNANFNTYGLSDRQLANIEALAQGETNKQYEIRDVKELEIWDEEEEVFIYMGQIFCVGKGNLDCP